MQIITKFDIRNLDIKGCDTTIQHSEKYSDAILRMTTKNNTIIVLEAEFHINGVKYYAAADDLSITKSQYMLNRFPVVHIFKDNEFSDNIILKNMRLDPEEFLFVVKNFISEEEERVRNKWKERVANG